MSTVPTEPSKETAAGTPPATGAATAAPVAAAAAPVEAKPDPALADLQKQLAKATKELASEKAAREEQGAVLGKLKSVFGDDPKKDPLAEFNAVKSGFESAKADNARMKAEYALARTAFAHEADDPDEHFTAAQRAGVIASDYSFDPAALTDFMAKRKAERPKLFKDPPALPAAAKAGPPAAPGSRPPAPVQPANEAPKAPPPAGFDAWVSARTAN